MFSLAYREALCYNLTGKIPIDSGLYRRKENEVRLL